MLPVGDALLLATAGLAAGTVNALAGGGSLLSFPALLAAGYPPVTANVTNTVALLPGYAASVVGGRRELAGQGPLLRQAGLVGLLGGVAGTVVLLTSPADVFDAVVPFLVLAACALLLAQPRLARRVRARATARGRSQDALGPFSAAAIALAAVYGAYFGAGVGVVFLGVLGIALDASLSRVNAVKNWLSLVVNGIAVVGFGLFGPVAWEAVAVVGGTALLGGLAGARLAGRVPAGALRAAVVTYGVAAAAVLLLTG